MNALTLLKQDHQNVEALFQRFEKAAPDDADELRSVADKAIEHLSVHASIEEQLLYPALRAKAADHEAAVLEALEEHHAVKMLLNELEKLAPGDERFAAKLQVIAEQVRHHVQEEEDELFATAREAFTVQELEELGRSMQQMKQTAPTRPHPFVPDTPPFNILIGVPMAILDRVVTTGRRVLTRR
ncbi:MAG TPA: hemerythrin domain-containing protein [Acidimicrobiales bacterium]|nr:hemerythrin domain-containing protein [Acidimicrobiales bacterium]